MKRGMEDGHGAAGRLPEHLIDVSDAARREGFAVRVAVTRELYGGCVRVREPEGRKGAQAGGGQLVRLLRMLKAALATRWNGRAMTFTWVARTRAHTWRLVPTRVRCARDAGGEICLILGYDGGRAL